MKKFIITLLALFYLGSSSGATVHFHYCMGRLIEWSLASKKDEKCSSCKMKTEKQSKKSCCKHQQKQVKVDAPQKLSQNTFQAKAFCVQGCIPLAYHAGTSLPASVIEEYPLSNSPPYKGSAVLRSKLYIPNIIPFSVYI